MYCYALTHEWMSDFVPRPSPKGWVSDFVPLPLVESSLPHPFGRVT
nr:hypothetical protein Q903MT_gene743 [Picea sitchensis]